MIWGKDRVVYFTSPMTTEVLSLKTFPIQVLFIVVVNQRNIFLEKDAHKSAI